LKCKLFFTWKGLLLWSNHFYGICGALLAIESSLIIKQTLPSLNLILFIYAAIVFYYTLAYLNEQAQGLYNERTQWYANAKTYLLIRQFILAAFLVYLAVAPLGLMRQLIELEIQDRIFILITLLITALYYIPSQYFLKSFQIRSVGFIKSISIAWVWTLVCCWLPLVIENHSLPLFHLSNPTHYIYLLQQFIFILMLTILFDIKDINRDVDEFVKTVVVKYGARTTIFRIIIPLLITYIWLGLYVFFRAHQHFLFIIFPFFIAFALIKVIYMIPKRKKIHENVILIDGLIIIKTILGISLAFLYH